MSPFSKSPWGAAPRLGKGSFGQVFKCFDHKNKETVALKVLRNKKRLYKQGLIEAKVLDQLRDNDPDDKKNIIRIKEKFMFRKHLRLSFEMLSMNLYEFIKSNNFQGVSVGLVRRFAIQLLVSLHYMKEYNIIHCDVKPENIFINSHGQHVLADLGNASHLRSAGRCMTAEFASPVASDGEGEDVYALGATLYTLFTKTHVPSQATK